ncbi:MAG: bifunctional diaminohydroxyphosphoribosylaminopyrimidine deaminase/5-amino-6-(5-phosphoribosylamino)uracil reductase RibD [Candidatus Kryptoniota bacterium]
MFTNEDLMLRCIRLARNGKGNVSPNPMVGCVIVKDNSIIGEGYHENFGGAHAEVNAIRSATESVAGANVYVNLEPCSFYGKTPPCTDLLIEKQVGKIYVAMLDPNPLVNGKGAKKLKEAGIEVEIGLASQPAEKLNEAFIKFMTKKLPLVTLKIAQSIDGRIALKNGKSKYITSKESLRKVHELRAEHDAVLVGAGTIKIDDPKLTVRLVKGRSPVRIILDGNLSSPVTSRIFTDRKAKTILFCSSRLEEHSRTARKKINALKRQGVEVIPLKGEINGTFSPAVVLNRIGEMGIASVLVEGGADVFSQFIKSRMADKLWLFVAPKILGRGASFSDGIQINDLSKAFVLKDIEISQVGVDHSIMGYF